MKATIDEAFKDVDSDDLRTQVTSTNYYILNETDGLIILPKFWESLIKPGYKIRMELCPMKKSTLTGPPLPPPIGMPPLPPPGGMPPPPPPPDFTMCAPMPCPERPWKKKHKRRTHYPPPGTIPPPPPTVDFGNIVVLDRDIWMKDDQDITNRWIKNLSNEVKTSPLLRAPGMFRAPAGLRDDFKIKSEVLCANLGLDPYYTATFIVRMLCKVEKNHDLQQEQWPDVMIVVLQAICEHNLHRRKHGSDFEDSTQKLQIDNFLAKIYRRGLLPLPEKEDENEYIFLRRDRSIVESAAYSMNIWSKRNYLYPFILNPDVDTCTIDGSEVGIGYNFLRLDELDIGSLLSMGKVNIAWTDCLEKHLQLDVDNDDDSSIDSDVTDDSTATLYIYWFDFTEYAWMGS